MPVKRNKILYKLLKINLHEGEKIINNQREKRDKLKCFIILQ